MSRSVRRRCLAILPTVGLAWFSAPLAAHDLTMVAATVTFDTDETYRLDLICDLDALSLGLPPGKTTDDDHRFLRSLPADEQKVRSIELQDLLRRRVQVRFDGVKSESKIEFLYDKNPSDDPSAEPPFFGITSRFTGAIPVGASQCTFWASRAFGLVILSFKDAAGADLLLQTLKPGDESNPCVLGAPGVQATNLSVVLRYGMLGFEHILPKGLDHILFVLGLYLLGTSFRSLLWQVTAFTVAHSVTLALSIFGIATLSSGIVEPLIAVSIVFVGVENVLTTKLQPWRPVMVFGFGLLHGLGFAGVLTDLGLPRDQKLAALVSFNLGVELGQLAVIALALAATGWCRKRTWYRSRVLIPASIVIAVIGTYWAIERTFG